MPSPNHKLGAASPNKYFAQKHASVTVDSAHRQTDLEFDHNSTGDINEAADKTLLEKELQRQGLKKTYQSQPDLNHFNKRALSAEVHNYTGPVLTPENPNFTIDID